MKKNYQLLIVLVSFCFVGLACDEMITPPQQMSDTREGQDVIHVGNGMNPEVLLALKEKDGLVLDLRTPTGISSEFFMGESLLPLVVDAESGDKIEAELGWLAKGEKNTPIMELAISEKPDDCTTYETLGNGRLICRDDLDRLSIRAETKPGFSLKGDIAYLDPEKSLRLIRGGKEYLVHRFVDEFFFDKYSRLVFRLELSQIWKVLLATMTPEMTRDVLPLAEATRNVFLDEDSSLLVFQQVANEGFKIFEVDENLDFVALATLPETLEVVVEARAIELSSVDDISNNMIYVRHELEGEAEAVGSWVRMNRLGFELLESEVAVGEEEAVLEPKNDVVVQSSHQQKIVKSFDEQTQTLKIEFCRSQASEVMDADGVESASCSMVELPDNFVALDALLTQDNHLVIAGHYLSRKTEDLLEDQRTSGIDYVGSALLRAHKEIDSEDSDLSCWNFETQLLDQPIERIRILKSLQSL